MSRFWWGIPVMVPLEDAEAKHDLVATPMEKMMADEARQAVMHALSSPRSQMVFLLVEYGFSPREIVNNTGLSWAALKAVRQDIEGVLRKTL